MSKKEEVNFVCPTCKYRFRDSLYRTIWGEYPSNRELVMSDRINVVTCPRCKAPSRYLYPFLYTNARKHFAVWWEPQYDPQIDADTQGFAKLVGKDNYLTTAPRIQDWEQFKQTILKFERGELKGKENDLTDLLSGDMHKLMRGFVDNLKSQEMQNKKTKSGWLSDGLRRLNDGLRRLSDGLSGCLSEALSELLKFIIWAVFIYSIWYLLLRK